jgi:S1-C subfamily serine protease
VRIETTGGIGSGFVVGDQGYIITNNHVVQSASNRTSATVKVRLSDGTELQGKVLGTDPRSDLALVKVESKDKLPALTLANLDDVQIGQDVVAIGYALDLAGGEGPSFSVTRGIISQKNRAIQEGAKILGAIQTDAAINHGNSGGPLLTLTGEVVGVNTSLVPDNSSASGTASGIGLAVGSDTVRAVFEQLRDTGKVNRGLLGIANFEALRPAKAKELGMPGDVGGVYLADPNGVPADGPAGKAGIQAGDVITKIDATVLRNEGDLAVALIKSSPGQQVEVEFYRGGKKMTVSVTLGTPTS